MNLFQLIIKQMRQRALSSWLTIFSVLLGVGLAVAVMICRREGASLFGQTDYGYDLLIGAKGSPLQLTLNTVYDIDRSPGNIPYALYDRLTHDPQYRRLVRVAVPTAVGDSYRGRRIVATTPAMFNIGTDGNPVAPEKRFEYRPGRAYEVADGHVFDADKFEAVIGSDFTRQTGLKLGDTFQATHGFPAPGEIPDIHKPKWTVVGVLKPTHTAADGVVFIPLPSFYCIAEHGTGLVAQQAIREGKNIEEAEAAVKAQEAEQRAAATQGGAKPDDDDEPEHFTVDPATQKIHLTLPKEVWGISAILISTRGAFATNTLQYDINNGRDGQAANPARVMLDFFSTFLDSTTKVFLLISLLVIFVAAVSILVSIYNSVAARQREIAIYRALGATRRRILALICLEAGAIGLFGGVLGLLAGHLIGAAGSVYLQEYIGEGIRWTVVSPEEFAYLAGVFLIAVLAGLVPALKAYGTPVAENLVSQ
jgi:putative ABC transport system permease protein